MKLKQAGITLLEILLVLAIGSAFLVLGMRMYLVFKKDSDVRAILLSVDAYFQAASIYYRAQCSRAWDPAKGPIDNTNSTTTPTNTMGRLDPGPGPGFAAPTGTPINIDTTTLSLYASIPRSFSTLIDYTTAPTFVIQFNPVTPLAYRKMNVTEKGVSKPMQVPPGLGQIVTWRIQVAVRVKNAALYKNYLGADCTSVLVGSIVTPCATATPGPYVVWERLPSYATPNAVSDYWLSDPLLNQFKQMYTTYPISYLTGPSVNLSAPQYYLCGS